jgi:hypothetical protein
MKTKITIRQWIIFPKLGDWEYFISPFVPPRNISQNSLLWALYTLVERETWNDKEYLHEMMKKQYLSKKKLVKLWWKRKYVTKAWSSTKLNRKEFSEFFTNVEQFFWQLWYYLPPGSSPEFQSLISNYY